MTQIKNHKLNSTYCIILNQYNQCLVLQRHENDDFGGHWDLPGGGMDAGESLLEAAYRELKEETGIENIELKYQFNYVFKGKTNTHTANVFFGIYKNDKVVISQEHQNFKWLSINEAKTTLIHLEQVQALIKFVGEYFPSFAQKPEWLDPASEFGERGIAIIKIAETGQFLVYDKKERSDLRIRFPGGHIDPGENSLQAATREVWEEAGITDLKLVKYLGSSHGFYNWAKDPEKIIHKLDHYYQFEISLKVWQNRKTDQKDEIGCFLADLKYLKANSSQQILNIIENITQ